MVGDGPSSFYTDRTASETLCFFYASLFKGNKLWHFFGEETHQIMSFED